MNINTVKSFLNLSKAGYIRRWAILSILIGIAAGVAAIIFYWGINEASKLFLGDFAGFFIPHTAGEGGTNFTLSSRPWLIPIVTTLGGLISGLIVFTFAPEAEGDGVDAAIDAFHNRGGFIRKRIPFVKLIASIITIGSGGSVGREGPTAQMAAGIGSTISSAFKLPSHDRRIALAVGIGAGIGTIFSAPLGGAVLAMELLYRHDFETEALFPAFIASVVGYSIFGSWHGWAPVFGLTTTPVFNRVPELLSYIILGVVCGLIGIAYGRSYFASIKFFKKLPIPRIIKPAIGGLVVGVIGMFLPQILGTSYGWLQIAIDGDFNVLPLLIIIAIVFAKIFATSVSIGSGGSGGVLAPGLVIGGMTGAAVWAILHHVTTIVPDNPGAFAIVGMLALFGGIAKAPVATLLMVTEMTGGYSLLVPSLLAISIAYFVTGNSYLFEKQVADRSHSPAHRAEHCIPLLRMLTVQHAATTSYPPLPPETPIKTVDETLRKYKIDAIPIVDSFGYLVGVADSVDIAKYSANVQTPIQQIMRRELVVAFPDESLYEALAKMNKYDIRLLPVTNHEKPYHLLGMVTMNNIMECHKLETEQMRMEQ